MEGVRPSMINHALTEEDTRNRVMLRNLVLGERKSPVSGKILG
jgi:hypothetical protein